MEWNAALGIYMPSFFSITLNFGHHIKNVEDIPEHLKPTFYHEYFHFIQDVTTPYGFHLAWGNMSRVTQSVSYYQKKAQEKANIPIPDPERAVHFKELKLFEAINGDSMLQQPEGVDINVNELQLVSISLELRPEMEPFEEEPSTRFIRLVLRAPNGQLYYFWLGAKAVIECMANLIEEKHFGETHAPRFPYKIVQEFIRFVRPEIGDRKDIMFVLCDLALQTNHPGFYLNSLLVNSRIREEIPENPIEIFCMGFEYFNESGYDVDKTFEHYKNKLQINIGQLFGHQVFQPELRWVNVVIENGFRLRNEVGAFMLDLYNAENPILDVLPKIVDRIGTPDIVNFNFERVFTLPVELRGAEEQIHPVLMTALFQFYKDLLYAEPRCALIELCRNHDDMPVNPKCYEDQWKKTTEKGHVCPLMAFYRALGLENIITGELVNRSET